MPTFLSLIAIALFATEPQVKAKLTTPHYTVHITELCEDDVACNRVDFELVDHSGKITRLRGKRLVVLCNDGVTPCHPYGYEFHDHHIRYYVGDDGEFSETRNGKELIHEDGEWQRE